MNMYKIKKGCTLKYIQNISKQSFICLDSWLYVIQEGDGLGEHQKKISDRIPGYVLLEEIFYSRVYLEFPNCMWI